VIFSRAFSFLGRLIEKGDFRETGTYAQCHKVTSSQEIFQKKVSTPFWPQYVACFSTGLSGRLS